MIHVTVGAARLRALPELRLGLAAWGTFILATCAYCLVYQAFVSAVTPDVMRTLTVALREWGAWALLAPWTMQALRVGTPVENVLRCVLAGLLAALLPVVVDQVAGDRAFGASLALFWPRNVAMAVALLIIARAFAKPAPAPRLVADPVAVSPIAAPAAEMPGMLMVSKGADQCLIRIQDIHYLSAAGNYVDIRAGDQNYLMRTTMAELEGLLPSTDFVRIHRSHIVRVRDIERIRVERSGSGTVHLKGGGALAISKGYRAQLKARQDPLKARIH